MIYEVIGKCGSRVTLKEQFQGSNSEASAFSRVHALIADLETNSIDVIAIDEETLEAKDITKFRLEDGQWKCEYATVEDCDL